MRVIEDSASSTSCAIMSEEKSLNGTESDGCISKKSQSAEQNHSPGSDYSDQGFVSSGGRLKFFKDGKFILELSHRRDGEKMSWIPVPKKTYWPPPVTTSTVTNSLRQESTTSLSVSDDNSSVQLSPWQRDHCWKQTSPRKAASHDLTFLMIPLPRAFHVRRTNSLTIKRKRRRPFDPIEKLISWKALTNLNGFQRPVKLKNCAIKNGGLNALVQRLWDYCLKSSESTQSGQKLSPSMFSPRKRILREFERVSLVGGNSEESQINLKRQRPKMPAVNGQTPSQGNSKGVSSYSITSLLGTKEESQDQEPSFLRTLLRSPKEEPSPEPSPKSRRNSPSQNVQSSPPPPVVDSPLRNAPFPSVQFPYVHSPLLYPAFLPQSPIAHHSSYFGMPSAYRGSSPALWGVPYHPHLSSPLHGGSYHGFVSPYSSSQFNFWPGQPPLSEVKREDGTSVACSQRRRRRKRNCLPNNANSNVEWSPRKGEAKSGRTESASRNGRSLSVRVNETGKETGATAEGKGPAKGEGTWKVEFGSKNPGTKGLGEGVDYVYFETSSTLPYQIRRIEELNKTPSGNVEAKVMCFFRRRDLPNSLIVLADKHQMNSTNADDTPISAKLKKILIKAPYPTTEDTECNETHEEGEEGELKDKENSLNWKQRHQLKHRELFLSRQVETLPATHIRGKCSVTLLNETESVLSYLNKEDTFFYCLVFDPAQKTLLADKGEIRVGSRYQAEPIPLLREGESDNRNCEDLETLVWTPSHHLTDRQIDQFLVISRSVGTFARALDCSSSVKQPSLHMSAAAASRDVTLFHAMDTLHNHNYNLSEAISRLVPSSGPVLCRDEMEEWSASEANLFEEALEKYGKDFSDIRQDFLPWKTLKNIIEYYYMWKTTDRYVQQKRVKAVEAESKLKQVYIPNYNKPNPAVINNSKGVLNGNNHGDGPISGKSCESCQATSSSQWYAWGPSHTQYKLCHSCWTYWKKYGGLKNPSRLSESEGDVKKKSGSISDEEKIPSSIASHRPHRCTVNGCGKEFKLKAHLARHYATAHGVVIRSGSPRPIMKTRTAFYLHTTPLTRLSRRLCRHIMQPRHAARSPFWPINVPAIKQECQVQMAGKSPLELKELLKYRKKDRGGVTQIANRLGDPDVVPEWLLPTDKNLIPKSLCIMFPKPPKGPDGSLLYERVPNKPEAEKAALNNISPSLKRRAYDENGLEDVDWDEGLVVPQPGPPTKRPNKEVAAMRAAAAAAAAAADVSAVSAIQGVPRSVVNQLNGQARPKVATMTRTGTGRKGVISWMDAPDDVYFRSTVASRKMRRQLSAQELRRASRKPWRKITLKGVEDLVVLD